MIIDSHVHIKGGDTYRREFDPDETVRMLDEAGIEKACVFSICLPTWESNDLTRQAVLGREDRLIPYAHVLPEEGDLAHLELDRAVLEWGFKALKFHAGEIQGEPSDETAIPFLEHAASLKIPVLLDSIHHPDQTLRWVEAVPQANLILAHMGSNTDPAMNDRFINLCRTHENVWLDTSYSLVPWKIRDAVRVCGAEKVIFGSDGGANYYPSSIELAKIRAYRFTEAEERLILGDNIWRLLGME
ncbi:MAG: amidohydrolase family protein [Armatimonadetes bacterium]|nr:amidohydrolase family protein [Armatimonadota bacterium]